MYTPTPLGHVCYKQRDIEFDRAVTGRSNGVFGPIWPFISPDLQSLAHFCPLKTQIAQGHNARLRRPVFLAVLKVTKNPPVNLGRLYVVLMIMDPGSSRKTPQGRNICPY
jgi:hypothetical protein